ncbi:hypothetical protein ACWDKQ_35805, partial [Saccharopolyspora sp. NPDC000995]
MSRDAAIDDAKSDFDEAERKELLERLRRLSEDGEPSGGPSRPVVSGVDGGAGLAGGDVASRDQGGVVAGVVEGPRAEGDSVEQTVSDRDAPDVVVRPEQERFRGERPVSSEAVETKKAAEKGEGPTSARENGASRRKAWPGVGSDQGYSAGGGARSISDSSSSDVDGSRLVDPADRIGRSDRTGTNLTGLAGGSDRIDGPIDPSNDSEPPNQPADSQVRVGGVEAGRDSSGLGVAGRVRGRDSLSAGRQVAQTVGAGRVVEAVKGVVGEGSDPVGLDEVEFAVLNEVRSLRGEGREFEVGGVAVRVQAEFDVRGSEAVEGDASGHSAAWAADHKAGAAGGSRHRPRFRQLFFMPAVPGLFALGAFDLPTGLASSHATSRTDTHSQSVRIALPERARPGGDSDYAGAQAVFVPVTFRVSRVDKDGHST